MGDGKFLLKAVPSSHGREFAYWIENDGETVAAIMTGKPCDELAPLFAAAPDLLDACEKTLSGLDSADPFAIGHGVQMMKGAIAKAKGE